MNLDILNQDENLKIYIEIVATAVLITLFFIVKKNFNKLKASFL